jgi:hypothetical protein
MIFPELSFCFKTPSVSYPIIQPCEGVAEVKKEYVLPKAIVLIKIIIL